MLSISELNQIIKHYAYQIQQRIDDLDRLQCPPTNQEQAIQPELLFIISKYQNYISKDQKQNKLAQKLVERILQIFDFFKSKSKNQNLLTMIQQKIQSQLNSIIDKNFINLGELISYIRMIVKPGGIIRVPAEKRRIFSKSIIRQSTKNQTKISPTLSLFNIQKRGNSLNTPNKHIKNHSLPGEKWKMDQILNGVWNCFEIQRIHLVRVKQANQQVTAKQMFRRNDKTLQSIKQYQKRWRLGTTEVAEQQRTILSEMKSNVRTALTSKRKRIGCTRRQNTTFKENLSIIL